MVFAVALLFALALAACFTAGFTDGTIKCSTDDKRLCPGGATCVSGLCYHNPDLATPMLDLSGTFGDDLGRDLSGAD
jgi:hypothetical protein